MWRQEAGNEKEGTFKILLGLLAEKDNLIGAGLNGRITPKCVLRKITRDEGNLNEMGLNRLLWTRWRTSGSYITVSKEQHKSTKSSRKINYRIIF
jgi:hypothetical protein